MAGEPQPIEPRVAAFNAPETVDLVGLFVEYAARSLKEGETTIDIARLREVARQAGTMAAKGFFNFVGSGEIDFTTGVPGEIIRFKANPESSVVPEGSSWSWLRNDNKPEEDDDFDEPIDSRGKVMAMASTLPNDGQVELHRRAFGVRRNL